MNEKKKLSPWAWAGIGCGCLILIIGAVVLGGGLFVGSKVKEAMGEFEDNPALAGAVMAIKLNPELELVETDKENETLTIRKKDTGEEITVSFKDIEQGKFSFESDGKEFNMEMSGGEEGGLTVTGPDGEQVFQAGGGGGAEQLPEWVPIYPGAGVKVGMRTSGSEGNAGMVSLLTDATLTDILDWYETELKDAGYEVSRHVYDGGDGSQGGVLNGRKDNLTVNVTVGKTADGQVQAGLQYQEQLSP